MTLTETDCTAPVASIPQPPLDLHRLEQFVAVVETGSLTDAAVRLSVSQQALSVAIRALEKQVGVTLFIRGKGMRPSPAGLHLYESAQILLAAARRMVPELRAIGEAHTERLRVGYTPSVSSIDVLETIGNRVPATARLQAERLFHRTLRDRLLAGEIDIALRRGGGTPRGLGNAVVRFDRLNVAVRTEHAESIRNRLRPISDPVQLTDLARLSLILWAPESRSRYSTFLLAQCRRLGFEPTATVSRFQGVDLVAAPLAVDRGFALVTTKPGSHLDGRITVMPLREEILAPLQALWLPTAESGLVGEVVRSISGATTDPALSDAG